MGDDCLSYLETIHIWDGISLHSFIRNAVPNRLASIGGGKATWEIGAILSDGTWHSFAIIAQQWAEPKFIAGNPSLRKTFSGVKNPEIFARYHAQKDPDEIFSGILKEMTETVKEKLI
jgi:hypothetical protein